MSYDRQHLHRLGFISELLSSDDAVKSIRPLLRVSQDSILRLRRIESAMIRSLERDPCLAERVRRLQTVPCVGRIPALTWALEMGDISRFDRSDRLSDTVGCVGMNKNPRTYLDDRPSAVFNPGHRQHFLPEDIRFVGKVVSVAKCACGVLKALFLEQGREV